MHSQSRADLAPEGAGLVTGEAQIETAGRVTWRSQNGARAMSPESDCRLFSRHTLSQLGGFRSDIGLGADRELLFRLALSARGASKSTK